MTEAVGVTEAPREGHVGDEGTGPGHWGQGRGSAQLTPQARDCRSSRPVIRMASAQRRDTAMHTKGTAAFAAPTGEGAMDT